jgi:Aminoacyl tRNA synthetase class II, N-terminal domain
MSCEEKARLVQEYDVATLEFSGTVKELHQRMGTSPKEEYKRLAQISNEARVKSEQARQALEQHIAAHGC